MRTVFVTGASSAIGRLTVAKLCVDHRVYALVHRTPLAVDCAAVSPVFGEIRQPSSYAEAVAQADTIVHVAGLTHSDDPEEYHAINHQGTAALLSVCRKDQRLVAVSSRCVGEAGGAYSLSKERAEQAILAHGMRCTIVRPSEVYGTNSGEGIDQLLRFALARRVVVDFRWGGSLAYSPIGVDELCSLLDLIVRREARERAIYTVCNTATSAASAIRAALADSSRRRYFIMPVPVRILMALQGLGLPLPFAKDQLTRLAMPKSNDCRLVQEDYGFSPQDFLAYVSALGRQSRRCHVPPQR